MVIPHEEKNQRAANPVRAECSDGVQFFWGYGMMNINTVVASEQWERSNLDVRALNIEIATPSPSAVGLGSQ